MNRRNFIANLLSATAGFYILPSAGRIWKPTMPIVFIQDKFLPHDYFYGEFLDTPTIHSRAYYTGDPIKTIAWRCFPDEVITCRSHIIQSAEQTFGPVNVRLVKNLPPWFVRRRDQLYKDAETRFPNLTALL